MACRVRASRFRELANLIDAMLDSDPEKRPGYSRKRFIKLSTLQSELQKFRHPEGWHGTGAQNGAPQSGERIPGEREYRRAPATMAKPAIGQPRFASNSLSGSAHRAVAPECCDAVSAFVNGGKEKAIRTRLPLKRHTIYHAKRSTYDIVFSTLLFCMTGGRLLLRHLCDDPAVSAGALPPRRALDSRLRKIH